MLKVTRFETIEDLKQAKEKNESYEVKRIRHTEFEKFVSEIYQSKAPKSQLKKP